jgi:hypothetical protein
MRQQQLRYRYRRSRRQGTTLLREVYHQVLTAALGRQIPEELVVVVEAEEDRQDHQEDRRPRDYLQDSERKDYTIGMRELTRSYLNDPWHSRDT